MNFFDYELSRTATATPPQTTENASSAPEPSLNDEVNQVVGQLGRLWGGFRKQSQAALETARKDLSSVVAQAQKEFGKLTADAEAPAPTTGAEAATSSPEVGPSTSEKAIVSEKSEPEDEASAQPSSSSPSPTSNSPFQFHSLLSRVQSSLPPNISATLERTIPAALKDPSSHAYADLSQLRATLSTEFARVQGVTRAQAEEYVHRSEALLREAGAYLKDAVRVIPPEESGDRTGDPDVVFDGMGLGVVVMPPSIGSSGPAPVRDLTRGKGKSRETAAQAQQRLAGSRAAVLLAQLRRDLEIYKKDPLEDPSTKELYETWFEEEVVSKDGGIESPYWTERTKAATNSAEDGEALRATHDALVPLAIDDKTFWTRYFFRVHQIEKDEEKRKALLAASGNEENDEDFSWEDDEDESVTPSEPAGVLNKDAAASGMLQAGHSSHDTLQPSSGGVALASYPESLVTSPSNTSPRESSDGYDVVSPAGANTSEVKSKVATTVSKESKDTKTKAAKETEKKEEDDGDSDWE